MLNRPLKISGIIRATTRLYPKYHYMKRLLTLLIIFLSVMHSSAQGGYSDKRPIWFGVNMGGTWQTSDMKPVGGIGWGVTVARYSRMSKPGPLYFGWRFRFLDGRNFGYNYNRLPGIAANPVLSSGATNYSSGTTPDTGSVYSNYKMRFDEFAFELIVGSNSLRKHGVLLYGFGAAGLNYWKTTTDQLDAFGNRYDYNMISPSSDQSLVQSQLETMWDGEYETNANGSATGQWAFMPSAGIGFGYQWSNFAIVAEHRTTWALTDLIDGTNHNYLGAATGNNDIYHYDGLTLRWNFSSHSTTNTTNNPPPPPPNPNNYNHQPPPPNNNTNNTVNTTPNNNNTNPTNNTPTLQPPTVQFTTPNVDPYIASVLAQNLVVRVTNVTSSSQISLVINGQPSTNFSFNPTTETMTFAHTLQPGNNLYKVVATNAAGSAQDVQTITYKGNEPTVTPPTVTITTPSTDPYTSTTATYTVNATIVNVPAVRDVRVTYNGNPLTNFSYNATTGMLSFVANLQAGNNVYQVTGSNSVGSASDAVTIVYGNSSNTHVPAPPVVTITNPNDCPFQTKTATHTLTANITNVTQASQVTVVFNNQTITNFTYMQHGANGTVSFPVTLNPGANNLSVTGTNVDGTNTKTCVLTYKPQTPDPIQPPVVTITAPAACPTQVSSPSYTVTATITNVSQASQVTVVYNNQTITNFSYTQNGNNANISFPVTLNAGPNSISITGTNTAGTDNKTCSVVYRINTPVPTPPDVEITSPSADPFTATSAPITFKATVLNVASSSEITVKVNGVVVTGWTYDMVSKVLTYNMTLSPGNTIFKVGAQNANGSDVDQTTVILKENIPTPAAPPTVTITQPSADPFSTTVAQQTITATVTNITQKSQITVVKTPNTPVPFTFDAVTHTVSFSVVLTAGNSTYKVTATNNDGTANDATTLTLTATTSGNGGGSAPIDPGNGGGNVSSGNAGRPNNGPTVAPVITLVTPASNNLHVGDQQYAVTLLISDVASAQQIQVKVNNVILTSGVNYNPTTDALTFTASLNNGTNVIRVGATNSIGTTNSIITVNYVPSNNRSGGDPEPKKVEEKTEEPKKVEPKKEEPKKEEPKKEEPKKAEPSKEEPKKTEPTKTEVQPTTTPSRGIPAPSGGQRPR